MSPIDDKPSLCQVMALIRRQAITWIDADPVD